MVPNVGVRIQEANQSKTGGLDFKSQFGRMSMKEYEMLRQKYSSNNYDMNHQNEYNYKNMNTNNYNNNININKDSSSDYSAINYNNFENKSEKNYGRSHTYERHDEINKKVSNSSKNVAYLDSHMKNAGLKYYNWDSEEKIPEHKMYYDIKENYSDNNRKVLNENLFKRNDYKKKHSIYAKNYINNDKNKNGFQGNDVNNFNNQIMRNKDWGNVNSSNNVGKINFNNSIKNREGPNMRTRKK